MSLFPEAVCIDKSICGIESVCAVLGAEETGLEMTVGEFGHVGVFRFAWALCLKDS